MAEDHSNSPNNLTEHTVPVAAPVTVKTTGEHVISMLPKVLLLMAIWGAAVFMWGTFGAWTRTQHLTNERAIAAANVPALSAWLATATEPLQRLAVDGRLAAGMDLPAGVESLPVQRVLYEYAYLTNQSEVYLVDMLRHRIGRTASAAPLPPEVLARLNDLPDDEQMIMGMGQRNGQMLLIRKVKAPLPQRLLVMVPVSLMTFGGTQPAPRLPAERTLSLVVPHTSGWAQWDVGATNFLMSDSLTDAMNHHETSFENPPHISVLVPVSGMTNVWVAVEGPGAISGTRILPQLLVGLWALMMSAIVLWNSSKVYRAMVVEAAGPIVAPVGKLTGPMKVTISKLAEAMRAKWRDAKEAPPLVAGPGAFGKDDFTSTDEMVQRANLAQRKPKSAANALKQAHAKAPENMQKLSRVREDIAPQRPALAPMAWPQNQLPLPPKPTKPEPEAEIDSEDMRAIVEDCLRKKRVKLLYQPIIRSGDNMPVMHEVYARLVKANGDIIPPNVFLPIAIKHKLALELDLVVLRKVVNEHFTSGSAPATPLALNISSTSLDGIAYLQEMSNQGPRVLQKISFEVSSQEMIRDPKALRLLKDLQKHGGNLAVDYFGGGVAMLAASKAMGFNYVKLNCMRLISTDAGKKEMITMCQHAQKIGLPIIMEMVGDKAAYEFAKRAGAEFLQGYALQHPQDRLTTQPLTPDLDGIKNLAAAPL